VREKFHAFDLGPVKAAGRFSRIGMARDTGPVTPR